MSTRKQNFSLILLGVFLALAAFVISSGRAKHAAQEPQKERAITTAVPRIVSHVTGIRVNGVSIKNAGASNATVVVEVENTSEVGVTAISMESTNGEEGSGVSLGGSFQADGEPLVVIKPHEARTLEIALVNVFPDVALEIGSVMYADGTENGREQSLKILRDLKNDAKKKAKMKESPQ